MENACKTLGVWDTGHRQWTSCVRYDNDFVYFQFFYASSEPTIVFMLYKNNYWQRNIINVVARIWAKSTTRCKKTSVLFGEMYVLTILHTYCLNITLLAEPNQKSILYEYHDIWFKYHQTVARAGRLLAFSCAFFAQGYATSQITILLILQMHIRMFFSGKLIAGFGWLFVLQSEHAIVYSATPHTSCISLK